MPVTELVNGVLSGKRRELARLISLIENEDSDAAEALSQLYRHTGKAHIVGVTGPPGSGKSSLVTKLTAEFRSREKSIGIVSTRQVPSLEVHFSAIESVCRNTVSIKRCTFVV